MLAMVIVVCKASLLQMHLRTAHPGWITLDQRVQLVPCGNLIPGVMGDGSLDDFDLGLHVRFNADEMWLHDLRSLVWDLHSLNMWDFNVEGLGVWGRNRRLLRDLEHLVHFRSMNLWEFFSDVNRLSNKYINSIRNLYHEDFPSGNIFFSGLLFTEEKVST